jgi:hypothetical protein
MLTATLVAALACGSALAQAHVPRGLPGKRVAKRGKGGARRAKGRMPGKRGARRVRDGASRCARVRKVAFLVGGTFLSGDDTSVTLTVKRANRHARDSGLVTIGEPFTATPTDPARIRYVNRTGPSDAQPTDKVVVIGRVTKLRRGCSAVGFTPTVKIRKVVVIGPETGDSPT